MINEPNETLNNQDNHEEKSYFFDNANFQLLKQCRQEIFNKTQVLPSIRKLVNDLITQESVDNVKAKYLEMLK